MYPGQVSPSVRDVSLVVEKGECFGTFVRPTFNIGLGRLWSSKIMESLLCVPLSLVTGLLGVNGAGKSTTVSVF